MSRTIATVAAVVVLAALPIYLERFWLQTALFAMAAMVAAIGLSLLVGIAGQLSLGHAFFVAIGAYGYSYLTGPTGLPPLLALVCAVALAGLAGALFSPIAGRVRGIYLGLASLGLVFLGQHILQNATGVTGGYEGVAVEPFSLFGFSFSNTSPDELVILGVPYGQLERLWYLGVVLVAIAVWYGRNLVRSRPGRALTTLRDSDYKAANPKGTPSSNGSLYAYAGAQIADAALTKACENKDLTRQGVLNALRSLNGLDTGGTIAGTLDFTDAAAPPGKLVYIAKVSKDAPDGLEALGEPAAATDAEGYEF